MMIITVLLNAGILLASLLAAATFLYTPYTDSLGLKIALTLIAPFIVIPLINLALFARKPKPKFLPVYGLAITANIIGALLSLIAIYVIVIPATVMATVSFSIYYLHKISRENKPAKTDIPALISDIATPEPVPFSGDKVKEILRDKYNFKPEYLDKISFTSVKKHPEFSEEKYNEKDIADIFYTNIINQGYKNHPDYFDTETSINESYYLFSPSINKMIFGAYYPDKTIYTFFFTLYLLIGLMIHESAVIFMQPPIDSFLPSFYWSEMCFYMNITLSVIFPALILKNKRSRRTMMQYYRGAKWTLIFLPFTMFFILHTTLTYSLGEVVTEIIGSPNKKVMIAQRGNHIQCVTLTEFQNTLLFKPDACVLSKEDHRNMGTEPIKMTFTGKESILGFVVKDYEWPDKDK